MTRRQFCLLSLLAAANRGIPKGQPPTTAIAPPFAFRHLSGSVCLIPSDDIPLASQLVLVLSWQHRISQLCPSALCYPWWTTNGCGLTLIAPAEDTAVLWQAIATIAHPPNETEVVAVQFARHAAVGELHRWRHNPFIWLLWHARLMAMRQPFAELDEDKPLQVSADRIASLSRDIADRCLLVFFSPQGPPREVMSLRRRFLRSLSVGKSITVARPTPSLTAALYWTVTDNDPVSGSVMNELFRGGTGALWFQRLRGSRPLAYHALAHWQLTPTGGELALFAQCLPEHLPIIRAAARQLLETVRRGQFSAADFARAKRLALLRHYQTLADPQQTLHAIALWRAAGHTVTEWQRLPERVQGLSLEAFQSFCARLPITVTEVVAP